MNGGTEIIAICHGVGVPGGSRTGGSDVVRRAKTIAVMVNVEQRTANSIVVLIVDHFIAIVIDGVTNLICIGMHILIGVIAIKAGFIVYGSWWRFAGPEGVRFVAVAI